VRRAWQQADELGVQVAALSLSIRRSWDGNASPRAAANPSVISSLLNWSWARR
jgi:hypothetical protein